MSLCILQTSVTFCAHIGTNTTFDKFFLNYSNTTNQMHIIFTSLFQQIPAKHTVCNGIDFKRTQTRNLRENV